MNKVLIPSHRVYQMLMPAYANAAVAKKYKGKERYEAIKARFETAKKMDFEY